MTPTLQIATLLAIIATTAASPPAVDLPSDRCHEPDPPGLVCTEKVFPCLIPPCPTTCECVPKVPSCLTKKCGPEETCVMTTGDEGYEEPECVPVSHECPNTQITCDNVRCAENTECRMVGCSGPECVPVSHKCLNAPVTCATVLCAENTQCRMVGCKPKCV